MSLPRVMTWIFISTLPGLAAGAACAQTYPSKPIRFVTSEPGGGADSIGSAPEQLETTVKSEMSRLGKVIRDAGIRE